MKAAVFEKNGDASVLEVQDIGQPFAEKGEVLIKIASSGMNRAEVLFRQGMYFQKAMFPSRIGMEAGGVVEEVGEGVTRFKVGDRVATLPAVLNQSTQGSAAEYTSVNENFVVMTPESVGDQDSAAIWMQYLTAWGALNHVTHVKPGNNVVIPAASSSVGVAAIQIVNDLGGNSIATTTSASKVERLKELGAKHVIDVKNEDYEARIKEITGGNKVNIVFDPVAGKMMASHINVAAQGAWIFLYGVLDPSPMSIHPGYLVGKNVKLAGYNVAALLMDPPACQQAVATITDRLNEGKYQLVIDKHFPLGEVADAYRYMESNQQIGKIVLNP